MYLVFQGARNDHGVIVTLNGKELEMDISLALRNHSPDGPEWGYGGSGPAQLALAMLLWVLIAPEALALYQLYKFQVISSLPHEGWTLTDNDVREWARHQQPLLDFRHRTEVLEVLDSLTDDDVLQAPGG